MKLYIKILCISTFCSILTLIAYSRVSKKDKIEYQTKFNINHVNDISVNNKTQNTPPELSLIHI